jgi:hypothetical protein
VDKGYKKKGPGRNPGRSKLTAMRNMMIPYKGNYLLEIFIVVRMYRGFRIVFVLMMQSYHGLAANVITDIANAINIVSGTINYGFAG